MKPPRSDTPLRARPYDGPARDLATPGVWLLSGGLESTALLFDWAQVAARTTDPTVAARARIVHVDYGQRNAAREWGAVQALHAWLPVRARPTLVKIDLSALRHVLRRDDGWTAHVPAPERNLLLVALARNVATAHRLPRVVLGLTRDDRQHGRSGDARWWDAVNTILDTQVVDAGDARSSSGRDGRGTLVLETPLRDQTKAEVIATRPQAPWHLSWSCLLDRPRPCQRCPQCAARASAFERAGVSDPLRGPPSHVRPL